MELNKQQSYLILYKTTKRKAISRRYSFKTKTEWNCISCGCRIYISYKQYSRNAIFCPDCFSPRIEETVVQLQYLRRLKEVQLKLIEKQLK